MKFASVALAGMLYFDKYTEKVQELMKDKSLGDHLTVQLAAKSAQDYLDCDPEPSHPQVIDYEARRASKIADKRCMRALLQRKAVLLCQVPEFPSLGTSTTRTAVLSQKLQYN